MLGAVLAVVLVTAACESRRVDPLETFVAASCASIQGWIDAVEDATTELSHAVTPLDRSSARVGHYRRWARSLRERTDDTVRQLQRIAPAAGDGRAVAVRFVAAMKASRDITEELVALADSFPDGDDDPEPTVSRISSLLVRLEKVFVAPGRARDELAVRYPVLDEIPSCADYDDPVT